MHKKEEAKQRLLQQKLLPLYYHQSLEVSIEILKALYAAGIRVIEYTNRGESALANFTAMKKEVAANMPDMLLSIGTIKNARQAEDYIKAGADFIICPSVNAEVARVTHDAGLLWIPGCMTPTEIADAEIAGASLVKIFPGNILGPDFISAVKSLFEGMQFLITGGVEAEEANLKGWFGAGAAGVGMGSKLITKSILEEKNYGKITELTKHALQLIQK